MLSEEYKIKAMNRLKNSSSEYVFKKMLKIIRKQGGIIMYSNEGKRLFEKFSDVPISVYDSPYFEDEIKLKDKFNDSIRKSKLFEQELSKYKSVEIYREYIYGMCDKIVDHILESKEYQDFNQIDFNELGIILKDNNIPENGIYKDDNIGKKFISIDMIKANFTTLRIIEIIKEKTYEDFISKFTDDKFIAESKYFRQVVFGNLNPKRIVKREKIEMINLAKEFEDEESFTPVSLSTDEILIEYNDYIYKLLDSLLDKETFKIKSFTLIKIKGPVKDVDFYMRLFEDKTYDFKCMNRLYSKIIFRKILGEAPSEYDLAFKHDNILCKIIDVPDFKICESNERDVDNKLLTSSFEDFFNVKQKDVKFKDFFEAWNFLEDHRIFKDENELSSFLTRCLDIEVVKVDPLSDSINDDESKNTATRVWLECGEYNENYCNHDIGLDCGGKTFEEAIIELANLVSEQYD